MGRRDRGERMKITKKQRKEQKQLAIQRNKVQKIEDFLIEHADPVDCPAEHFFTNNQDNHLNICCRKYLVPKDTILTGAVYKIEVYFVLVSGRMRLIEGDHTREIEAPCLVKNKVGTKNSGYAYEDCLFYGFTPNPKNSRDTKEVMSVYLETDPDEIMGMPKNKQQLNYQKRLINASV